MNIVATRSFFPTSIFRVLMNVEMFFQRRATYRQTVRELERLNERELTDLGLCRADIAAVAKQAVAR